LQNKKIAEQGNGAGVTSNKVDIKGHLALEALPFLLVKLTTLGFQKGSRSGFFTYINCRTRELQNKVRALG
jgi:hypothetical protein